MKKILRGKTLFIIAGALVFVIIISGFGYGIYRYQKIANELAAMKTDPNKIQEVAKSEQKKLIEQVEKLMVLPSDEEPTVATVTDPEKLKDQPFFSTAKAGDKVLIYANARKAILFDPTANKIIDVSPINLNTSSPSANLANSTPTPMPLKIALYNGTEVVGITQKIEKELKDKIGNIYVPVKENAKKKDYPETLIIDLMGSKPQVAEQLAKVLNGKISSLPAGENKPADSDILVIVGADKK